MLRHLVGVLAGLAVAPPLWVGVAWAAPHVTAGLEEADFSSPLAVLSVLVLLAAGVGGAYLVASRLSPLTALVSGALLLALCVWAVATPASVGSTLPDWLGPDSFVHPVGPALPIVFPFSALLFLSGLLPARWRAVQDTVPGTPAPPVTERVVASTSRERYRREHGVPDAGDGEPRVGGADAGGPGADGFPGSPGLPPPPPLEGDPNKTTTPFRRTAGGGAATWEALPDEDPGHTRFPHG